MLQSINDRIQGWLGWLIVALISVPFALWGIQSYLDVGGSKFIAKVNDVEITTAQFDRALSQQRARMQQIFGKNMPDNDAYNKLLKKQVTEQLITTEVMNQYANQNGFTIADQSLAAAIRSIDAFKEDGQFSQNLYERVLNSQGMSLAGFEAIYRQELATAHIQNAIMSSAFGTGSEASLEQSLKNQQRNVSYILFKASDYMKQATISDEEAQQFYQEKSFRFMNPEKVSIRYIELKADQLATEIPVNAEDIQKSYDEYVVATKSNEQRKARHILINLSSDASADDEKAAKEKIAVIKSKLDAGEDFAKLAQANSDDEGSKASGGDLGLVSKGMMVKPFEDALFAMNKGQISDVVRSEFGFHIIKLDDIQSPKIESFASKKSSIEKELKESAIQNLFYERAELMANLAYENPESLDLVAEELKLEIKTSSLFTRANGTGVASNQKVRDAAFQDAIIKENLNSDAVEISNRHVVVLRVDQHKPSTAKSFDEVKAAIVNELQIAKAGQLAAEKAKEVVSSLNQAGSSEAWQKAVAAHKADATSLNLVKRDSDKADRNIIQAAFKLAKPSANSVSVKQVSLNGGNTALVAVHSVVEAKSVVKDAITEAARKQLDDKIANQEFAAAIAAIKSQFEIYIPEQTSDK